MFNLKIKKMNEVKLSLVQIELMKHAIGFDSTKIKRGKYEAYRNRYLSNELLNDDWEYLVKKGLAEKRNTFPHNNSTLFFVSDLGLKYLGELFDCTITEID